MNFNDFLGGLNLRELGKTKRATTTKAAKVATTDAPPTPPPDGSGNTDVPNQRAASFEYEAAPMYSNEQALSVAAFNRAVTIRATTMSLLVPAFQRRRNGCYVTDEREATNGKRLNYLFQVRPNSTMSAPVMWRQAMINVDLEGNAVIYIERNNRGEEVALWLAFLATRNPVTGTYDVAYNTDRGMVSRTSVDPVNILHLRAVFSEDNSLTGLPLLQYARKVLRLAATNDKLVLENAAKGGKLKLLVQEQQQQSFGFGRANMDEMRKLAERLNIDIYKSDVICANNIANVTPISQSIQQQEIQAARQFSVKEIARITGVPPFLLMDEASGGYKSPDAATQEFLLRTLSPIIREWECEMTSVLVGYEGFGQFRVNLLEGEIMRLDPKTNAEVTKIRLECGTLTVNEARADINRPPVKGGDEAMVSTNMQSLANPKVTSNNE